jgi:hypothetical protein
MAVSCAFGHGQEAAADRVLPETRSDEMGLEDEKQPLTSGTTFTPSVLKEFRCDLETDCRCSPEMRPTCEYNVKARPARDSAVYDYNLKVAKKAEPAEKQLTRHEVNSPMAARLLVFLFLTAATVVIVTWQFGEWIRGYIN